MYLISGKEKEFFYFLTAQTGSGSKSPSYSMGNDGFSPIIQQLGLKPKRAFPSAAELKNEWSPAFANHMPSWRK